MKNLGIWDDPENCQLLKEWWESGLSAGIIANKFKEIGIELTKNSIIGKVHRLKLKRNEGVERTQLHPVNKPAVSVPLAKKVIHYRKINVIFHGGIDMPVGPKTSSRILLKDTIDGQCRAIVDYVDGKLSEAVCCGERAPMIIRNGRVVHSSWCEHHHNKYTIEGRYESGKRYVAKV